MEEIKYKKGTLVHYCIHYDNVDRWCIRHICTTMTGEEVNKYLIDELLKINENAALTYLNILK